MPDQVLQKGRCRDRAAEHGELLGHQDGGGLLLVSTGVKVVQRAEKKHIVIYDIVKAIQVPHLFSFPGSVEASLKETALLINFVPVRMSLKAFAVD